MYTGHPPSLKAHVLLPPAGQDLPPYQTDLEASSSIASPHDGEKFPGVRFLPTENISTCTSSKQVGITYRLLRFDSSPSPVLDRQTPIVETLGHEKPPPSFPDHHGLLELR